VPDFIWPLREPCERTLFPVTVWVGAVLGYIRRRSRWLPWPSLFQATIGNDSDILGDGQND